MRQIWACDGHDLQQLMRVGKQGDNQEHVQAEWDLFVRLLTNCFEFAIQSLKRSVSDEDGVNALDRLSQQGGVAQKGQLAKHQWVRPVLRGAGDPLAGESLRRARRRLARLHELRQFICRRGYVPLTLFHKLWKGSAVPTSAQDILAMAQTEFSELQRLQSRMEAQLRDRRLREWKASLSEGTFGALGKWIKGKQMVCRKVTLVQQGVEAETHEQSARFIREHWESVWSEGRLANPALSRQLASDFGFRPAGHWVGPSASDLHRALLHCKGSAGPDQWHSAEAKHLPFDAVQVWWTLTSEVA